MKASTEAVSVEIKIKSQIKLKRKSLAYQRVWFSLTLSAKRRRQLIHPLTPPRPVCLSSSAGRPQVNLDFIALHSDTLQTEKKTLGKVTEEQSRRQGFFFLMHLDFIVGSVPTNGWAAAGKHPLHSSLTPLSFNLPQLLHTHEPALPTSTPTGSTGLDPSGGS